MNYILSKDRLELIIRTQNPKDSYEKHVLSVANSGDAERLKALTGFRIVLGRRQVIDNGVVTTKDDFELHG